MSKHDNSLKFSLYPYWRDRFFDLMKPNTLLVRKTKRNVYTTMSKHHYQRYPNLVKGFSPMKTHELWVSDINYIPLKERFAYLFLITGAAFSMHISTFSEEKLP